MYYKIVVVISAVLALGMSSCKKGVDTKQNQGKVLSLLEEVLAKKTLDVGYINYPPGFIVDPNTNEYSGIFQEVLEEIASRNNLKVNYKEPVTWATMIHDIDLGKVDMIANPVWATDARQESADFTDPVYFSPIGVYVKFDDNRFVNDYEAINDPKVRIAAVQGEINNEIGKSDFPSADLDPFTNDVDVSQLFLEIKTGRKDVTFAEPMFAYKYMQENPGAIKNIGLSNPIRNYPNSYMIKKGEKEMLDFINSNIHKLAVDGTIDKILSKYVPFKGAVISVTDSLATPKL